MMPTDRDQEVLGGDPSGITKYNFNIKYNKPVVITEFGGDALSGYHADASTRWSEEYQEALYKNQIPRNPL